MLRRLPEGFKLDPSGSTHTRSLPRKLSSVDTRRVELAVVSLPGWIYFKYNCANIGCCRMGQRCMKPLLNLFDDLSANQVSVLYRV